MNGVRLRQIMLLRVPNSHGRHVSQVPEAEWIGGQPTLFWA